MLRRAVVATRHGLVAGVVIAVLAGFGCGSDDEGSGAGTADAGSDAGADGTVGLALTPPEPPNFLPCPAGWREVIAGEDEPPTCEPWPEGGRLTCAADEAHFPGQPACRVIGTACTAGDEWASDLPSQGTVLFVRAGADPGGAGTRESPFATVAEALAAAPTGAVVALSRGRFEEAVTLPGDVTLWGACTAETLIVGSASEEPSERPDDIAAAIAVEGLGVVLRNLQVTGDRGGIRVEAEAAAQLDGVLVAETLSGGLVVLGVLEGQDVVVRGTRVLEEGRGFVFGLGLFGPAQVSLANSLIEDVRGMGVLQFGRESHFTLSDGAVRGIRVGGLDDLGGIAVGMDLQAEAELNRVVLEDNAGAALVVAAFDESGSEEEILAGRPDFNFQLSDVVVRAQSPLPSESRGITALAGRIQANRMVVRAAAGSAWFAAYDADLQLTDVLVVDTVELEGFGGFGITLIEGSAATLERVMLLRNLGGALWLVGENPSRLTGTDVIVQATDQMTKPFGGDRETEGPAGEGEVTRDGTHLGGGLMLSQSGHVQLTRFLITDSALMGIQVAGAGTLALHQGEVSFSPIGINLQNATLDLSGALDEVLFRENERDLDTTSLPVPDLSLVPTPF